MEVCVKPDAKAKRRSKLFFLKQYLRKPFGIGAVAPSGQKLAQLMVEGLGLQPDDVVVELGPGTGVFTRELLAQGVNRSNLILVEFNSEFVKFLGKEFPGVRIVEGDARALPQLLRSLGQGQVSRVVSGIPLRSMKPAMRNEIAKAIAEVLKPGGILVQFSYLNASPLTKIVTNEVGLVAARAGLAMSNMPPAFVWKYVKAA
jgi:phosphatidylethanolamine/phosphatidyl-N-methylethanolamine N-methyltransferase